MANLLIATEDRVYVFGPAAYYVHDAVTGAELASGTDSDVMDAVWTYLDSDDSATGFIGTMLYAVCSNTTQPGEAAETRTCCSIDFSDPEAPAVTITVTGDFVGTMPAIADPINRGVIVGNRAYFPVSASIYNLTGNVWAAMPERPLAFRHYRPVLAVTGGYSIVQFGGATTLTNAPAPTCSQTACQFDTGAQAWLTLNGAPVIQTCYGDTSGAFVCVVGVMSGVVAFRPNGTSVEWSLGFQNFAVTRDTTVAPAVAGDMRGLGVAASLSRIYFAPDFGASTATAAGVTKANTDLGTSKTAAELAGHVLYHLDCPRAGMRLNRRPHFFIPEVARGITTPWGTPTCWDGERFIAPIGLWESADRRDAEAASGLPPVPFYPLWVSEDGLTFTELDEMDPPVVLGQQYPCVPVLFSGGNYISHHALGVQFSTDLETWTAATFADYVDPVALNDGGAGDYVDIIEADGKVVGLQVNGKVCSSTDHGETWQWHCNVAHWDDLSGRLLGPPLGTPPDYFESIAYGNGRWVVVRAQGLAAIYSGPSLAGPFDYASGLAGYPNDMLLFSRVRFLAGAFYLCGFKVVTTRFSLFPYDHALILRSTDAVTWTEVTPVASPLVFECGFSTRCREIFELDSGRIVALGENVNFVSEDGGLSFTEQPMDRTDVRPGPVWSPRPGPDYFSFTPYMLAGASNGDAICCTLVRYEATESDPVDNGGYVAGSPLADERTTCLWDGATLTQYSGPQARALSPARPKLWDGSQFIAEAVGPWPSHSLIRMQQLMVSPDGETWTAVPGGYLNRGPLAFGGGLYVGGNEGGRVSASADLSTWTQTPYNEDGAAQMRFRAAAYAAGTFVLVGSNGIIASTPDGSTAGLLVPTVAGGDGGSIGTLHGVAHTGTHWVIVGVNGTSSTFGLPRIYTGTSIHSLTAVQCPHNGLLRVNTGGNVVSSDPSGWGSLQAVHFAGGRLVAVGAKLVADSYAGTRHKIAPLIITSTDNGTTWADVSFTSTLGADVGSFVDSYLRSVVRLDSGLWIAVGMNADATSADGITWVQRPHKRSYIRRTERDPEIRNFTRSHLVTNGTLAICGYSSDDDRRNTIELSTDGVTWAPL